MQGDKRLIVEQDPNAPATARPSVDLSNVDDSKLTPKKAATMAATPIAKTLLVAPVVKTAPAPQTISLPAPAAAPVVPSASAVPAGLTTTVSSETIATPPAPTASAK